MNTWEMFVITNNERNYIVYVHIFPNGKRYVGITKLDPKKRWGKDGHKYKKQYVYKAIQKYGWSNIEHKILFNNLTEKEAKQKEIELIEQYNTTNKLYGYNITTGGEGASGYHLTEKHKNAISKAISGRNNPMFGIKGDNHHMYGKHLTEEHKSKISKSHKGIKHTEESKKKISINHADVNGINNPRAKSVICITTGRIFFTATEASKYYNIKSKAHITSCCKGKRKNCGKLLDGTKLVWRYVNYKHNRIYRVINR